jgi:CRP/FNR family transcriptional regulator
MTTACLLAYEDYSAEGVAETDIKAAAIPRSVFDDLISQSKEFRTFVFSAYSKRITDLFHVIEDIAFQRMDIRLAQKLLDLRQGQTVKATHQQLVIHHLKLNLMGSYAHYVRALLPYLNQHG